MRALLGRWGNRVSREDGSVLLLAIFSGLLCLLVILGVTVATSLYIERKRLFTLADGAATSAAEAFTLDDVSLATGKPAVRLADSRVTVEATDYLATATQPGSLPVGLVSAKSNDGRSATVVVAGSWKPPIISMFFPQGLQLTVSATARTVFG